MSTLGSVGNSLASQMLQWQQSLFKKLDTNGDGSLTKSELEQDVTSAGGTTASADALYAKLDPDNTGSVSEQQFEQNLPSPSFSASMGAQLIADQAQNSGTSAAGEPSPSQFAATLFSQLDSNGDGTLTKSELEQAVTSAGGTTASADALYAELDPDNTGSVTEQQFADNLPKLGDPSSDSTTSTSSDGGTSAADAMAVLMQSLAPPFLVPMPGEGDGSSSSASSDGTNAASGNSAQDALQALFDSFASASQSTGMASTGNSAQDALYDLANADTSATATGSTGGSTGTASGTTDSLPASLFAKFNQQILAFLSQLQAQGSSG